MARLQVELFGPFRATLDGVPLTQWAYIKVRALFAYLAIEYDRPHARSFLAALLWPDVPERVARQNLSQALATLRTVLNERDQNTTVEPYLLVTADTLQLNPASDSWVDVTHFSALLSAAEAHRHRSWLTCTVCHDRLQQAVALYSSYLLEDICLPDSELFEEWRQAVDERLQQLLLGAQDRLQQITVWRASTTAAARLPTLSMPLAGRQAELQEICALLRTDGRSLITLTGPSLAGKTHLALEAARTLRFDFADGVYFVAPPQDTTVSSLFPAIATALPLPATGAQPLFQLLTAELREQHVLLLVDACERFEDAATTIAALLASCPALVVLATSRTPLHIRAEQQYPLTLQ